MLNSSFVLSVSHAHYGACSVNGVTLPIAYADFMDIFKKCVAGAKNVKIQDSSYFYADSNGFEQVEPSSQIKVLFYPCKRSVDGFLTELKNLMLNTLSMFLNSTIIPDQSYFWVQLEKLIEGYTRMR